MRWNIPMICIYWEHTIQVKGKFTLLQTESPKSQDITQLQCAFQMKDKQQTTDNRVSKI